MGSTKEPIISELTPQLRVALQPLPITAGRGMTGGTSPPLATSPGRKSRSPIRSI